MVAPYLPVAVSPLEGGLVELSGRDPRFGAGPAGLTGVNYLHDLLLAQSPDLARQTSFEGSDQGQFRLRAPASSQGALMAALGQVSQDPVVGYGYQPGRATFGVGPEGGWNPTGAPPTPGPTALRWRPPTYQGGGWQPGGWEPAMGSPLAPALRMVEAQGYGGAPGGFYVLPGQPGVPGGAGPAWGLGPGLWAPGAGDWARQLRYYYGNAGAPLPELARQMAPIPTDFPTLAAALPLAAGGPGGPATAVARPAPRPTVPPVAPTAVGTEPGGRTEPAPALGGTYGTGAQAAYGEVGGGYVDTGAAPSGAAEAAAAGATEAGYGGAGETSGGIW